jgi:AcrR family transcriptional regulator
MNLALETVREPRLRFELHPVGSSKRRVIDAADTCVCRWGWSKTTVGDVAAEASMSRATLYRAFPGGRDSIFDALRRHRELSFFHGLLGPLSAGTDLETVLTETIVAAAIALRDDEHFQHQLANDPGPLLQQLTFAGLGRILGASRVFVAPHFCRFVSRRDANRLAEWATRIVLSYVVLPADHLDLTDPVSVRTFLRRTAPVDITVQSEITVQSLTTRDTTKEVR